MTVTEITPGKLVKVEPDAMTTLDVIELAEALIEEQGWLGSDPAKINQFSGGNATEGWTIHGAIGEAAKRATGSGKKDDAAARPYRDEAAGLMMSGDPGGRTEQQINDQAQDVGEVLAAMRAARGAS